MQMKELVERIVRALVDSPEEVDVQETEGTSMTLVQIKVAKRDLGKLIGKKGRNITALRTVVAGAGKGKRYVVEVAGEDRHPPTFDRIRPLDDRGSGPPPDEEGET